MAKLPPVTDTLARFVAEADFATISEKVLTNAKMHILETLGAALVGVTTDTAAIAFDYCKRVGHSDEATIWGTRQKSSAPMAAFANGLLGHAIDFDDWDAFIHAGHPTCMVAAAALSLGEVIGSSGKDLLKAYALGIEILTKIAANAPNVQDRGFHSTPVLGSIGAAIACASLMRLDAEKIKAALVLPRQGRAASIASKARWLSRFTLPTPRETALKQRCWLKKVSQPTPPSSKRHGDSAILFLVRAPVITKR